MTYASRHSPSSSKPSDLKTWKIRRQPYLARSSDDSAAPDRLPTSRSLSQAHGLTACCE